MKFSDYETEIIKTICEQLQKMIKNFGTPLTPKFPDINYACERILNTIEINRYYNGWCNYETWMLNLHLTNTEWLFNECLEQQTTEQLKIYVEGLTDLEEIALNKDIINMRQDLIYSTIDEIDFTEIFEHFEQICKEQREYRKEKLKKGYGL